MKVLEITIAIIIGVCLVIAILIREVDNKTNINTENITTTNSKYDSLLKYVMLDYELLKHIDSIKSIELNRAFRIDKDSINIDSRGYFYSKYHRKYKIRKD